MVPGLEGWSVCGWDGSQSGLCTFVGHRCLGLGGICSLLLSSGVDSYHPPGNQENSPKKLCRGLQRSVWKALGGVGDQVTRDDVGSSPEKSFQAYGPWAGSTEWRLSCCRWELQPRCLVCDEAHRSAGTGLCKLGKTSLGSWRQGRVVSH